MLLPAVPSTGIHPLFSHHKVHASLFKLSLAALLKPGLRTLRQAQSLQEHVEESKWAVPVWAGEWFGDAVFVFQGEVEHCGESER